MTLMDKISRWWSKILDLDKSKRKIILWSVVSVVGILLFWWWFSNSASPLKQLLIQDWNQIIPF